MCHIPSVPQTTCISLTPQKCYSNNRIGVGMSYPNNRLGETTRKTCLLLPPAHFPITEHRIQTNGLPTLACPALACTFSQVFHGGRSIKNSHNSYNSQNSHKVLQLPRVTASSRFWVPLPQNSLHPKFQADTAGLVPARETIVQMRKHTAQGYTSLVTQGETWVTGTLVKGHLEHKGNCLHTTSCPLHHVWQDTLLTMVFSEFLLEVY